MNDADQKPRGAEPLQVEGAYLLVPLERRTATFGASLRLLEGHVRGLLLAGLIGAVLAYGTTFLMTPVYRVKALLQPTPQDTEGSLLGGLQSQLGGLAAIAGLGAGSTVDPTSALVARLQAREFVYEFIQGTDVLDEFRAHPGSLFDQVKQAIFGPDPGIEPAYRRFTESVCFVAIDRRTGLVSVTVEWSDEDKAVEWANRLVEQANLDARKVAIRDARANLKYLQSQLEVESSTEVRTSIYGLMENQMNKAMVAEVQEQYAFKVIDPAYPPGKKGIVWPRRVVIAAACGVLAMLAWFGWVVVRRGRATAPGAA